MIPLARDALPMNLWQAREKDDEGDVTTEWVNTGIRLNVAIYSMQSTVTQTEGGQVVEDVMTLLVPLPWGCSVKAGDRLGPIGSDPTVHLRDVKVVSGQAECTGVRL